MKYTVKITGSGFAWCVALLFALAIGVFAWIGVASLVTD